MREQRIPRIPQHILVGAVVALATAALHLGIVSFDLRSTRSARGTTRF